MPDSISNLLAILEKHPVGRMIANPYRHELQRKNLRAYLEALVQWPCSGDLLVGEAPDTPAAPSRKWVGSYID